ncbi:MAG: LysR substrate-binding domain-containing protein [Pseudomonadota bacterium]
MAHTGPNPPDTTQPDTDPPQTKQPSLSGKDFLFVERVLTRMKLKQLRLLVAVERHKSILYAARELHLSQPAATKQIKDLEQDFGVLLFERTNRGVLPTIYGAALARHGRLILAQIANAAQELDDLSEGSDGRVVVGTLLAASSLLLPRTIGTVLRERPSLSVKIVEGTNDVLMPRLRSGELDMVVGRLPTHRHRDDIAQERLLEEPIVVVARAGHPLTQAPAVGLADLMRYRWILPPRETTLRRQIEEMFQGAGATQTLSPVESVAFLANRSLMMATEMLGIVPKHVVADDISAGALQVIDWPVPIPEGPVGVSVAREGTLTPAAAYFLEMLRSTAAEL